jgi:uncharacterized protein DUF4442
MSGKSKIEKILISPVRLKLFMLSNIPLAFIAGLKPVIINTGKARVSAPYRFINKNPFGSMYFAVQCMAAELATGILAISEAGKSSVPVSMLVINMQASFVKKSRSLTTFECDEGAKLKAAIARSILTKEGQIVDVVSVGFDSDGEKVAEFIITWSFKPKKIINIG